MEACVYDACALAGRDALSKRSSCHVPVPKRRSLLAGFPCQDVARCNPYRMSAREVILEGSRRTGRVFHAVIDYLAKGDTEHAWLEKMSWVYRMLRQDAFQFGLVCEVIA